MLRPAVSQIITKNESCYSLVIAVAKRARDIAEDFENLFPQCAEVTESYASGRGGMLRTWQYILRLFAPLM